MTAPSKLQLILAIAATSLLAQNKTIDVRRSTITIHVGKTGIFSGAGHEHWVQAPISSGSFNDSDKPQVEFKVAAAKMQVRPDSKVNAKDQAQIQQDMQEKVLESNRYPEIVFKSTSATKTAEGQWRLEGMLTLRGVSKPVIASVQRKGEAYVGQAVLRQTAFGIKPISAGGGTVKVKDELQIAFHIVSGST
jgi:polyisoprenoid-binding protein YceI